MQKLLYVLTLLFFVTNVYANKNIVRLTDDIELSSIDQYGELYTVETLHSGDVIRYRTDTQTKDHYQHILILESNTLNSIRINEINKMKLLISKKLSQISQTIIDLRKGCNALGSCHLTNNRNYIALKSDEKDHYNRSGACEGHLTCPTDMKAVCSDNYKIKVCIDTDLKKMDNNVTPEGNHTLYSCRSYCKDQGKRLPTNNEWLVASIGTSASSCLPKKVYSRPDYRSTTQMKDLSFNIKGIRKDRNNCVSEYGVRDMIGVLGQWVSDGHAKRNRAQFNGGLWTQPASTIVYRTVFHSADYTDYSIGCRCASELY